MFTGTGYDRPTFTLLRSKSGARFRTHWFWYEVLLAHSEGSLNSPQCECKHLFLPDFYSPAKSPEARTRTSSATASWVAEFVRTPALCRLQNHLIHVLGLLGVGRGADRPLDPAP